MRVAVDTQSTLGAMTGIGRYTSELVGALKAAGTYDIAELNCGRPRSMRLDERLAWQQMGLPARARRVSAHLLHVTGFDAPLWKPCPVVLTVHDLIGMIFPENLPPASRWYWSKWLPYATRFSDHVIAVSDHTKKDLMRLLGLDASQITVIHAAVGEHYSPRSAGEAEGVRRKYGLPDRFILFVGTIEPRKGVDTLLAAMRLILKARTDVAVVMAGKVGWRVTPLVEEAGSVGLSGHVRLLGHVAEEDMPSLYSASELLVLPSRYEGFGLPLVEAFACGTPVVCSNISSMPEVAGGAAVLVPPDHPKALAEALLAVVDGADKKRELREKGLRRAASFSWKKAAEETIEVYGRVLGRRKACR